MSTGKEKRDRAKELLKGPVVIDTIEDLTNACTLKLREEIDKAIYEELAKHATHKSGY